MTWQTTTSLLPHQLPAVEKMMPTRVAGKLAQKAGKSNRHFMQGSGRPGTVFCLRGGRCGCPRYVNATVDGNRAMCHWFVVHFFGVIYRDLPCLP